MMIMLKPDRIRRMLHPYDDFDKIMDSCQYRRGEVRKFDSHFRPPVDIFEDENNLNLNVELPGVAGNDVEIKVFDEIILSISGEKKAIEGEERPVRSERSFGEFKRSFRLPDYIDSNNINARFDDGVLKIELPRKEEAKPREIDIEVN